MREQLWRYGRLWTALLMGAPFGVLFALFELANSGGVRKALIAGASSGLLFGVAMSIVMWSRWKEASKLSARDRVAVARSVQRGEPVEDALLAPAVIEYATVVRKANESERRYRWTLWIWPAGTLGIAVAETVRGSTRDAVLFWGLVVFWIILMPKQRRRDEEINSRASRAQDAARRLLGQ
jgi:hypothetical protein